MTSWERVGGTETGRGRAALARPRGVPEAWGPEWGEGRGGGSREAFRSETRVALVGSDPACAVHLSLIIFVASGGSSLGFLRL